MWAREVEDQGTRARVSAAGHLRMRDGGDRRAAVTVKVVEEQLPEVEYEILSVLDGETFWTEVNTPMGRQVLRISLEQMAKAQAAGMGMSGGASVDQLDQLRDLFENYYSNFQVVIAEGRVTITGDVSPLIARADPKMARMDLKVFRMVLDEKTGFPLETAMGDGEKDLMTVKMSGLKFLKKEDIPQDAFAYKPPPGLPVTDLGSLFGG